MAMYGNFVVTSMGKGQLVKEIHDLFREMWQELATHGIHMDSWDQTKHGRPQAITDFFSNRDQYWVKLILVGGFNHLEEYESQWEGLSRLFHILWKITNGPNRQPVIELPDGLTVTSHIDHNLRFHIPQFQRTIIFHSHQAASKSILNFPATTFQIASYHSR